MKIRILFSILVFATNFAFSQQTYKFPWAKYGGLSSTITFEFCKKTLKDKDNFVFQIFLIYEKDTLVFPQIGKHKFLNPISYYNLSVDTTIGDTYDLKLLFVNSKYVYPMPIATAYLFQEKAYFCITHPNYKQFNFIQYGGTFQQITIGKRAKVKNGCVPCSLENNVKSSKHKKQ